MNPAHRRLHRQQHSASIERTRLEEELAEQKEQLRRERVRLQQEPQNQVIRDHMKYRGEQIAKIEKRLEELK